jgi:hypothetical protein
MRWSVGRAGMPQEAAGGVLPGPRAVPCRPDLRRQRQIAKEGRTRLASAPRLAPRWWYGCGPIGRGDVGRAAIGRLAPLSGLDCLPLQSLYIPHYCFQGGAHAKTQAGRSAVRARARNRGEGEPAATWAQRGKEG